MSRRTETLVALVAEFNRVHAEWVEDDNRPAPDDTYWDACTAVTEAFAAGEIPADCRELAERVEKLADELAVFDGRHDVDDASPHAAFWTARQNVQVLFEQQSHRELPPLETIAQLKAQNVSDRQIAMIYGFKDRRGNPLPNLVQREIEQPGSVLKTPGAVDGRDWADPRLADFQSADDAAERHYNELQAKREAAKPVACPESPRDLWEQGVSVNQAAKMLGEEPTATAEQFAKFDAEREASLTGGHDAISQAIREQHEAGKTVRQIQADLKVTAAQVKKALAVEAVA